MKMFELMPHLREGLTIASILAWLPACGDPGGLTKSYDPKIMTRDAQSKKFMDSEYVVQAMLAPEKIPDQVVTEKDVERWRMSLIPPSTMLSNGPMLNVDTENLSLAAETIDGTDVHEQSDLRIYDTPIRNQGSRPWCTAFATIAAVENLSKRFFSTELDLSEIHHFQSYQVYQTLPSLSAGKNQGFIDEALWPYYGTRKAGADANVRAKLGGSKTMQLNLSDVVASISSGAPVVINLDVNGSFMRPKAGGIIVPGGFGQGGHAIALTGVVLDSRIDGGGYFVIKNSWGTTWGDNGYGYIPFSYCKYSYCYAWSISDITVNDDQGKPREKSPPSDPNPLPSPAPSPSPTPPPTPEPQPNPNSDITAESFTLTSSFMDYRGLFGAHFFVLNIDAKPEVLSQVQSIIYRIDGYRPFKVNIPLTSTSSDATQSRSYKIWSGENVAADATLILKDGRKLNLKGISVTL